MNSCYSSIIHFDAPSAFFTSIDSLCVSTVAVTETLGHIEMVSLNFWQANLWLEEH